MFANGTKPYINLLWVVLPLILRKSEWKVRFSRAVYAVLTAAGALALTLGVEQYGTLCATTTARLFARAAPP